MEAYKRWVRRNKDYAHSLESLANRMTWLLPERFSNSEIGPEAVTAFCRILTDLNTHIIETSPSQTNVGGEEPSTFPYALCISSHSCTSTAVTVESRREGSLSMDSFGQNASMVADPMWLQRTHSPCVTPSGPVTDKPSLSTILSQRGLYESLFC